MVVDQQSDHRKRIAATRRIHPYHSILDQPAGSLRTVPQTKTTMICEGSPPCLCFFTAIDLDLQTKVWDVMSAMGGLKVGVAAIQQELEKLHASRAGANFFIPTAVGTSHQNKVIKSQLFVEKFSEKIQHSFLDYLASGYELNFMVAIDFTGYALVHGQTMAKGQVVFMHVVAMKQQSTGECMMNLKGGERWPKIPWTRVLD
nr:protein BONZAI 1-like [Ipomoea trifida]